MYVVCAVYAIGLGLLTEHVNKLIELNRIEFNGEGP
jgi:hypothetical protein